MQVVESDSAEIKLRTLKEDNLRLFQNWRKHLENWGHDEFIRSHSSLLRGYRDVYLLDTGTDLLIFFKVADGVITVEDLAHRETVRMFASAASREGA